MLPLLLSMTALAFPSHESPLRAGTSAPDDAAVVIGIEDYFALPDVPYARRDAEAMEALLLYTVGLATDRVTVLDNNASKEKILSAVADAASQVGPHGTLWISFAGHGAASPTTGERLLLGVDAQPDAQSFDARSVPVSELEALSAPAHRTVLLVDACYAGAGRGGSELLAGKRFAVPAYAAPSRGTFIEWTAAQPNELSGPLEQARHGAFTWAAVGALRGWADGQRDGEPDGVVTFDEAELYVQEVLRTVGIHDQRPVLRAEGRDGVVIALPAGRAEARPDPAALRAALHSPAPPAQGAEPQTAPAQPAAEPPATVPSASSTPFSGGDLRTELAQLEGAYTRAPQAETACHVVEGILLRKELEGTSPKDLGAWLEMWLPRCLGRPVAELKKDKVAGEVVQQAKVSLEGVYWGAAGLGVWSASKGLSKTLAYLAMVKALVTEVERRDQDVAASGPARFWGQYYASLPSFAGRDLDRSRAEYARAREAHPTYLLTAVFQASILEVGVGDRTAFHQLLEDVVASDPSADGPFRTANEVARARARQLLDEEDKLF